MHSLAFRQRALKYREGMNSTMMGLELNTYIACLVLFCQCWVEVCALHITGTTVRPWFHREEGQFHSGTPWLSYKAFTITVCFTLVDGSWSEWASSTACSDACGGGTLVATRTCTNPKPLGKGLPCAGPSSTTQNCNEQACPGTTICKIITILYGPSFDLCYGL